LRARFRRRMACGLWQERIPIRREVFPYIADVGKVDYRDMLVISRLIVPRKALWPSSHASAPPA